MSRRVALRFEVEAYQLSPDRIMGRQAAGDGFLRALCERSDDILVHGFGQHAGANEQLKNLLNGFGGKEPGSWILPYDFKELKKVGLLHYPDPSLAEAAQIRALDSAAAWSISGVTHTTASQAVMQSVKAMVSASVMPWDALICTSHAVRHSVGLLIQDEEDRLREMVGATRFIRPQLPVIPLGVHSKDFAVSPDARQKARSELAIADDEIAFLFVGRLSFHAKAHPYQMYCALNDAVKATGKRLVLVQCGWFANEAIEKAFEAGAQTFAPDVRHIYLDGRKSIEKERAWRAADVFISLSDNIQETFGLTPIEAMAAGLPVIISDWNGYRDTVRDGQDGFLIPTLMPELQTEDSIGLSFMSGAINYDHYLAWASLRVSVDPIKLREAITALVMNSETRSRMGCSGRERSKSEFEWAKIITQYSALWSDLDERRSKAMSLIPKSILVPRNKIFSPYRLFSSYTTATIGPETELRSGGQSTSWNDIAKHELFSGVARSLPPKSVIEQLVKIIEATEIRSIADLVTDLKLSLSVLIDAVAILTKWEIIQASGSQQQDEVLRPTCLALDQNDLYQRVKTDLVRLIAQDDRVPQRLKGALKLLAKLRTTELQQEWVRREGSVVRGGPYQGMEFLPAATEGCHLPKLIGSYEAPLIPIINSLPDKGYRRIINAGCGEGYHAVGLARLMLDAEILAFDLNPLARRACQTVAEYNNVSNRITIGGEFTIYQLEHLSNDKTLLFCDIEGVEFDLIRNAPSKFLKDIDLLIECHDVLRPGLSEKLSQILAPTHITTLIADDGFRSAPLPDWVLSLSHLDQFLFFWEWREGPTPWIFAEAKSK